MTAALADIIEQGLRAWIGDDEFARLQAISPGAGTDELIAQLNALSTISEWEHACTVHAKQRAQDACSYFKDGDLLYRDGAYIWVMYWTEVDDALKALGRRRRSQRRAYMEPAEQAFIAEVERIRCRRLGPPEARHLLDEASLGWSETLGEAAARRERAASA